MFSDESGMAANPIYYIAGPATIAVDVGSLFFFASNGLKLVSQDEIEVEPEPVQPI